MIEKATNTSIFVKTETPLIDVVKELAALTDAKRVIQVRFDEQNASVDAQIAAVQKQLDDAAALGLKIPVLPVAVIPDPTAPAE